ncbi:MAG: hydroxymethylglutaryl-CoA lyase [Alphaproteobacteria bacterium]|nr:hydroxymethylglutaryl-CoA lyase [Alphaproteobacteria bacterium]TAD89970.1 MAG: hydroxymethylglutaryl-CoA lyase [Alphaproteobacteria bacterium]
MSIDVDICEVGPRDGLQIIHTFMPTAAKSAWIAAEAAAGVREIEVASFVPPKLIPQFADAGEVVGTARTIPGLAVAALVPNHKGAVRAIEAGVHKLSFTLSVSESHSQANVRKSRDEQVAEFRAIVASVRDLPADQRPMLSGGLSTVFGCSIEGQVSEADVVRYAVALAEAGADDISLADTSGVGDPAQVRRIVRAVQQEIGGKPLALHLHNTMGLGLANVVAGLEEGIRAFDSSLGGLGGCPYAPGATGNIVTEDLVFLLESMGLSTGIDLDRLIHVRDVIAAALPDEPLYGHVQHGLPKRWHQLRGGFNAAAA